MSAPVIIIDEALRILERNIHERPADMKPWNGKIEATGKMRRGEAFMIKHHRLDFLFGWELASWCSANAVQIDNHTSWLD
jgi:hypothetical protein